MWIEIVGGVLIVAAIALGVVVYGKVVFGAMAAHAEAIGKDAQLEATSGIQWIWTKIMGWKTIILGWLASLAGAFTLIPADTINAIGNAPWATVVEQKWAGIITIACTLLIPLTHALGMKKAAETPPAS